MNKNIKSYKADMFGAMASGLCLIHCLATPIIFVAKACSVSCCASPTIPIWWKIVDFLFLIVSLIAIYYATRKTTKNWLKISLWISWVLLLFVVSNDSIGFVQIPPALSYAPAFSIIILHAYNYRSGRCDEESCLNYEASKMPFK